MTGRKAKERTPDGGTPSQQDEPDILNELGATPASDGDHVEVDEEKLLSVGAVDAASVLENRRMDEIVNKKRGGVEKVQFNVDDVLIKYEGVIKYWPANTLAISMKRLTGTPVTYVIESQPKSGAELYAAMRAYHGPHDEAAYDVKIYDTHSKQYRGNGRITMPDARPPAPPPTQGPPMTPYPYPPPYGQPPYGQPQAAPQAPAPVAVPPAAPAPADPVAMMGKLFEVFQQMQASVHHPPPPQPVMMQQPAAPAVDPVAMMQQMFGMFQQMQASMAARNPQTPQVAMPPPPQTADPHAMMAWMQQMFTLFQQMQSSMAPAPYVEVPRGRGSAHQPQVQPMMNPAMMGMPQVQPPPGMFYVPGFGYVPAERLFQAISGMPMGGGPQGGGPYRPAYGPRYGGGGPGGEYQGGPPPPPQRPKSAMEQWQEAAGIIRMATDLADEFRPQAPPQAPSPPEKDDDNPLKVIETGPAKIVINKHDGSARMWETGWANLPEVLKWIGEQREAIQKEAAQREREKQQRQQQLPPGYVEVTPGYQPPPGYVAVPVQPHEIPQPHYAPPPPQQPYVPPPQPVAPVPQQGLPPPPAQMPPPIQPQPRKAWGMPPTG